MTTATTLKNFLVTSTTDSSVAFIITAGCEINVVGFMSDLLITRNQYTFAEVQEVPENLERIFMNTPGLSLAEQANRSEVLKKFPNSVSATI